jgi:hypothetical protein
MPTEVIMPTERMTALPPGIRPPFPSPQDAATPTPSARPEKPISVPGAIGDRKAALHPPAVSIGHFRRSYILRRRRTMPSKLLKFGGKFPDHLLDGFPRRERDGSGKLYWRWEGVCRIFNGDRLLSAVSTTHSRSGDHRFAVGLPETAGRLTALSLFQAASPSRS